MQKHYYTVPDASDLPALSQGELDVMVAKHGRYLKGQKQGARVVVQYKNLSGLNLSSLHLPQAYFTGCSFAGCDMAHSDFENSSFFACDLRNVNLRNANLTRSDLRGAYIAGADLSGARMTGADLREGKIMQRGDQGVLTDRKRGAGAQVGSKTILVGAKLRDTDMRDVQARSADFTDADLSGVSLVDADLGNSEFVGANLSDCDMSRADLSHVDMRDCVVSGLVTRYAEKQGVRVEGSLHERDMGRKLATLGKTLPELLAIHTEWVDSAGRRGQQLDLSGYDLRDVVDLKHYSFTAVRAIEGNFLHQDLEGAELQSGVFDKGDFRDCNLRDADLRASSFKYANFARADLRGALLCPLEFKREVGSQRQRVDLSGANFRYADLSDCDLRECILMGVDLTGAVIRGSDLRKADFTGAILDRTIFEDVRVEDAVGIGGS